jgi:hypothetical protein
MNVETSNDDFVADVECCPLAGFWNGLKNKELGPMYCENVYVQMLKEILGEGAEIKIPQCVTKGAGKCGSGFRALR